MFGASFEPCSAGRLRKASAKRFIPSAVETFGRYPKSLTAREMLK
jgi:hypothetical protein